MSDPYKQLAAMLDGRMKKHAQSAAYWGTGILGTVTASGLKLDYFKHEIKEYLVADWTFDGEIEGDWQVPAHQETGKILLPGIPTTADSPTVPGEYTATFKFDDWNFTLSNGQKIQTHKFHAHLKAQLKPGDRVLVAPVNNGRDFVVIAKVVPNNG